LADAPPLDVLHIPGGRGQEALMDDEKALAWIRQQAASACSFFSVCTGALICGAAGLLKGRRATTHWASFHLLPYFGAIPINERVVVDGAWVFAAGVTAGIDGALRLAAELGSHGLRAGATLRQRHARDGASRDTRTSAAIRASYHGAARRDGATCGRQTRHRYSNRRRTTTSQPQGCLARTRAYWRTRQRRSHGNEVH
jgi:transcriptional regulator GlxA family with amidase domain